MIRYSELVPGVKIKAIIEAYCCIRLGQVYEIHKDIKGLYFYCSLNSNDTKEYKHYLDKDQSPDFELLEFEKVA